MAGERVNTYAQDYSDILALQLTTDKTFKGYHQLTLTEYDTTTVPAIAAGSAIECNGALYKFDTEEAISTTDPVTSATVADGTVYVCIVPDTTTATAAFTATAPTWSDSKQGWYGTGGQANYRYAEYIMGKTSTDYYGKTRMFRHNGDIIYYSADATERTTTAASSSPEIQGDLSLVVPVKQGALYQIIFLYSIKVNNSSYYALIYCGNPLVTELQCLDQDIAYVSGHYNQLARKSFKISESNSPVYTEKASASLHIAKTTGNFTWNMRWQVDSGGTVYVKDRKVMIREIAGGFVL